MAENFNLNDMMLDDNTFVTVPEGDYRFRVESYDLEYSTSTKLPENTQVIKVHMSVPCIVDGAKDYASVTLNLNVYSKALFAIRQFFECIGLLPEKGRAKMPQLDLMVGRTGICRLIQGVSSRGNEYNQVDNCYPPSKAPAVCDNDEAWNMPDVPAAEVEEENPFV